MVSGSVAVQNCSVLELNPEWKLPRPLRLSEHVRENVGEQEIQPPTLISNLVPHLESAQYGRGGGGKGAALASACNPFAL